MKSKVLSIFAAFLLSLSCATTVPVGKKTDETISAIPFEIAEYLKDEVQQTVAIFDYDLEALKKDGTQKPEEGLTGSGVILENRNGKNLIVLTAKHVVEAMSINGRMYVYNYFGSLNNKYIPCHTLRMGDKEVDLALIISDAPMAQAGNQAEIGRWAPAVGEKLFIVGSPDGHAFNVSTGILSSVFYDKGRDISYYRTDAVIYFGNSGGPVFDEYGYVVGIAIAVEVGRLGLVPGGGLVVPLKYIQQFVYGD